MFAKFVSFLRASQRRAQVGLALHKKVYRAETGPNISGFGPHRTEAGLEFLNSWLSGSERT